MIGPSFGMSGLLGFGGMGKGMSGMLNKHRQSGQAAGQDMSWMNQQYPWMQMQGQMGGQQQQPNNPIAPSMPPVPQMGQKGPVAGLPGGPENQLFNPFPGGQMGRGGIFGGGIAGGYRGPTRQNGLNLPGNQPGMSYLL